MSETSARVDALDLPYSPLRRHHLPGINNPGFGPRGRDEKSRRSQRFTPSLQHDRR